MNLPRPCFSKLVVLLTASLVFQCLMCLSPAEELSLSSDSSVDTRMDSRLEGVLEVQAVEDSVSPLAEVDGDDLKGGGFDLGLVVSAAYDDNIFLSEVNPESDFVLRITPRIAYVFGNDEGGEGAFVRFDYQPTGVIYAENGNESRIDQVVVLRAGLNREKSSIEFDGAFRRLGDATPDIGTPSERNEFNAEIRAAYQVTGKVSVELAAGASAVNYDASVLTDSSQQFGEVAVRYAYSPKTQVALAYRVGRDEVEGTGDQTFQRTVLRAAWKPRQKISVDLEAGFEHRSFDDGSDHYPVAELRLGWEAREGTELYLSGYRREEVSGFYPGQNYSLLGFTAGVSQRFCEAWTARLEGGYEKTSYTRVSGTGPAGRKDRIWFIRPSLEYEVNDHFRTAFFYQFSTDDSNRPSFGYDDHQIGVSTSYDF